MKRTNFKRKLARIWKYLRVFLQLLSSLPVLISFLSTITSYFLLFTNTLIEFFPSWSAQVMMYIAIVLTIITGFALTTKYLKRTQTRMLILKEFRSYFDQFGEFLRNQGYSYSICSMFWNITVSEKEKELFRENFENLASEYKEIIEDLKETEINDDFSSVVKKFNEIIEKHSKLVRKFVEHFRTAEKVEIVKRVEAHRGYEYYDEYYEPFREKYNHFLISYERFLSETKNFHNEVLPNFEDRILAPRLFYIYTSFKQD